MAEESVKEYSGKWWMDNIRREEKELDRKWRNSADKVVDRYLDDRDDSQTTNTNKYNIFWSNVQILKSALYANTPSPAVTRQNGDAKDDIGRTAALMLERMLEIGITKDQSDMHMAFHGAVEDRLIPGMGQVWVRYESVTEEFAEGEVTGTRVVSEEAPTDYVHWRDFIWSTARTWDEVTWVARRLWLKKSKFIERFGKEYWEEARAASETHDDKVLKGFRKGRAEVFEVWCKDTKTVYWVMSSVEEVLDERPDFLQLEGFFPCPKPLLATHTTKDVTPRPDYVMAQDQYEELDVLNSRIYSLTKALRVVGAYDSAQTELGKLFTGPELNMIPVDSWDVLSEKGGLKGVVDWFPVEQVANVLEKLMIQRQAVISQIYELTSISDIMRGATNPRETAKAQQLKAQYSSVRLQMMQQDVALFVRHALRIKAEIICRHFSPESIILQSQIESTESAIYAAPAIALLKDVGVGKYRIEVSEESLSIADYNAEREMRMELAVAVGQFISQSAAMVQSTPGALPYILRIVQWVISAFRGSSDIETVLDEAVNAASQAPPQGEQAPPPPPDHSIEVATIGAQKDLAIAREDNQTKIQLKSMELMHAKEEKTFEIATMPEPPEPQEPPEVDLTEVETSIEELAKGQQEIVKQLSVLSAGLEMLRLKKRVPSYDAEGNIVEVQEQYVN